jgi:hypothetical protein
MITKKVNDVTYKFVSPSGAPMEMRLDTPYYVNSQTVRVLDDPYNGVRPKSMQGVVLEVTMVITRVKGSSHDVST